MGFFDFFTSDIAIDLGTANTLIISRDEIVVNQPSIIAVNVKTGKVQAVGFDAMQMHEKTNPNIRTIRPLKDGVIADFTSAEQMIRGMIKMIPNNNRFLAPSHRMVVCIPSGITEVEKRAVKDSCEHAGAKEVYMIAEPLAAAIGIGIDVEQPMGNMIVDIGGGTTEIAVIALNGIVCDESIKIAGDVFTRDIVEYMRRRHNLSVGERTAELVKINVGSALKELSNPPAPYEVRGRDLLQGIPKAVTVTHDEIAEALNNSVMAIEQAVLSALMIAPPELSADIYERGIHLTGGGALLRGLDQRLASITKLPIHVANDPLTAVVRGTGLCLKNFENFRSVLMS